MCIYNFGPRWISNIALGLATSVVTTYAFLEIAPSILFSYIIFGAIGFAVARSQHLSRPFILIYSVSAIAVVALHYTYTFRYGTPYFIGGSDDLAYEQQAQIILSNKVFLYSSDAIGHFLGLPYHNSKGYVYVVSILMRIGEVAGGFHTAMPRFFNCMLLGLSAVLMALVSTALGLSRSRAITVALVTGLFPMMVYSAAHTFRDILVVFLLITAVYLLQRLVVSRNIWQTIIAVLAVLIITVIMAELRYLYTLVTIAALAVACYMKVARVIPPSIRIAAIGLTCVWVIVVAYDHIQELELIAAATKGIASYGDRLAEYSDGLSRYVFSLTFPLSVVGRLAYAVVTPLPVFYAAWEWNVLGLGTLLQFFYFPFLLLGVVATATDDRFKVLLTALAILIVGYVFGTFTFRHLTSVIPFASALAVAGYGRYYYLRRPIWGSCAALLMVAALAYLYLKHVL